jgi:hypothetical protein
MRPLTSLWEAVLCCALVLEAQTSAQEPTPQRAPQQQRQQQRQPAARSAGQTAAPKLSIERGADAPPMLLGGRRTAASDEVPAGSKGKRGGRGGGQRRVLDVPLLLPVVVASAAGLPRLVRRVIR